MARVAWVRWNTEYLIFYSLPAPFPPSSIFYLIRSYGKTRTHATMTDTSTSMVVSKLSFLIMSLVCLDGGRFLCQTACFPPFNSNAFISPVSLLQDYPHSIASASPNASPQSQICKTFPLSALQHCFPGMAKANNDSPVHHHVKL